MVAKRVLVVDDNRLIRMLIAASIGPLGCEIIEATDGEEGLAAALECAPDVILLDVVMPKLDGFQVLARLRETPGAPACRIAMLTTAASADDHRMAERYAVDAYIVKPFNHGELRNVVAGLLETGSGGAAHPQSSKPS